MWRTKSSSHFWLRSQLVASQYGVLDYTHSEFVWHVTSERIPIDQKPVFIPEQAEQSCPTDGAGWQMADQVRPNLPSHTEPILFILSWSCRSWWPHEQNTITESSRPDQLRRAWSSNHNRWHHPDPTQIAPTEQDDEYAGICAGTRGERAEFVREPICLLRGGTWRVPAVREACPSVRGMGGEVLVAVFEGEI